MRFLVHPPELLDGWPEVARAYISGLDGRVHATRVEIDGNILSCRRNHADSGKMHVAWPVEGRGWPVLSTSSLVERDEPYLLPLEIARGQIARIRDQAGMWELQGMRVPDRFFVLQKEAFALFSQAACRQRDVEDASRLSNAALARACTAAEMLVRSYTDQRLEYRMRRTGQLPVVLGCSLGAEAPQAGWVEPFCSAFNAASVPAEWRLIEPNEGEYFWEPFDEQVALCEQNRLLVFGGPLLDMTAGGMPAWLSQWADDFLNLQSFVCDFVETAVSRFYGRIRHWEVSARGNVGGVLNLTEENRLALTARTLETARRVDDEIQLSIRVDQPWGEYQSAGSHRLSPLQFVDAILRSGIGLASVNLEIAVGYGQRGSSRREFYELSRLVDVWSCLGIPLFVTLAFPSSIEDDEFARSHLSVDDTDRSQDCFTPAGQAEWIDACLPLVTAKQPVVGVFWTHFSDAAGHHYPNAGLIDANGHKPALDCVIRHRRSHSQADAVAAR